MHIHLDPRNVSLSAALQDFVTEKVGRLGEMVKDILSAHVVFQRADSAAANGHFSVKVHLAVPGKDVVASDRDGDLYAAIDKVSAKLARRLRKRKTRWLKRRHDGKPSDASLSGTLPTELTS